MTTTAGPRTPREVFAHMQRSWLGQASHDGDLLADDVVIEVPFAPPGRTRRFEGREQWLAFAEPERAALPVRFEQVRNVVVHETTDPEVIVAEYELAGTVTTTGRRASATFIGVLRVRDGKIVFWREYQNVLAIADALGQLPALLAATAGQPDPGHRR
ncbi:MAG TPA: nuclear transport factor 2 family protein [Streptosporangiaceae bacterium]|jgi:ketosteroid isomerase-like protein|nr:nuclear transport factor 2 family protein [Streptosporangiaceae bacterium]